MSATKTLILDHQSILMKLDRMACEICEENTDSDNIVFCGMNSRGLFIAEMLSEKVAGILPELKISLVRVNTMDGAEPVFTPNEDMGGKNVVLVDDVINTGRTLMHVLQNIFVQNPESIRTAFLAKREHRNYPVKADFVGISLATTLQEHVLFDNSNPSSLEVCLN